MRSPNKERNLEKYDHIQEAGNRGCGTTTFLPHPHYKQNSNTLFGHQIDAKVSPYW